MRHTYPSKKALVEKLSGKQKSKFIWESILQAQNPPWQCDCFAKTQGISKFGSPSHSLIGDFTGMIGDPTDRNAARKPLTKEEVLANAATYKNKRRKF